MRPIVFADFNNRDTDGCIRSNTVGTFQDLDEFSIQLTVGAHLIVSDGDITAEVIISARGKEGIWRGEVLRSALTQDDFQ